MSQVIEFGSKYSFFDGEIGRFVLTDEAQDILHRSVLYSHSGANEWCNHFVCELIDLYSGSSKYNYCLGQIEHEHRIPELWTINKEYIIRWLETNLNKDWFKNVIKVFDFTIDNMSVK